MSNSTPDDKYLTRTRNMNIIIEESSSGERERIMERLISGKVGQSIAGHFIHLGPLSLLSEVIKRQHSETKVTIHAKISVFRSIES